MSDNQNKSVEELRKEIVDLNIRLKRVEEFLLAMPSSHSYITTPEYIDDNYVEAVKLVQEFNTASASFLQRKMDIGYARAARLIDVMEENGIVGPAKGANPRKVFQSSK